MGLERGPGRRPSRLRGLGPGLPGGRGLVQRARPARALPLPRLEPPRRGRPHDRRLARDARRTRLAWPTRRRRSTPPASGRSSPTRTSGEDPVLLLMSQLRRTAAFARPAAAVEQLHDVAAAVLHGIEALDGRPRRWLGQVFAPGDYLAVWAVEHVIHQLDLLSERAGAGQRPRARASHRRVAGRGAAPRGWSVEDAALIGSGRLPAPAHRRRRRAVPRPGLTGPRRRSACRRTDLSGTRRGDAAPRVLP